MAMSPTVARYLFPLLTALGYWSMGAVAGFFAIPPGFASPIWPAAGFAFLMVLKIGRSTVFGVALGSFLLNLGFGGGSLFEPSSVWIPAFFIALGASCQSLVAWWLVHRFTQFPSVIQRPNDAVMLGVYGGPLACVVSSGVGVASLVYAGVIAPAEAAVNWLHWWIGDSIGVLIFAPIVLASCFRLEWAKRTKLTTFFLVYLASIVVATTLFVGARHTQEQKIEQLFTEKVTGMRASLEKQLQNIIHTSSALSSVFSTFGNIDYPHFENYAHNVSRFTNGTHALSWIPIIDDAKRTEFETQLAAQLARDITITERNQLGQLVPAGTRARYYPVSYIEPMAGNGAAIGFDLGSQEDRLAAINLVLETQQSVATAPITLVQETESQKAFLVLAPVQNAAGEVTSLVSSVYRVQELLRTVLSESDEYSVAVTLEDITDPQFPEVFYEQNVREYDLLLEEILPFSQRIWKIQFSPSLNYVRAHQSLNVWVVLISGFMIVTIFGLFILLIMSRNVLVEKEVEEKTRELNEALNSAKQANAVKSLFLASMSHELRTPLNSIIGFSVRLQKSFDHATEPKLKNALEVIERNGKHLLNLINDILDLSKIEAGKMTINRTLVKLPKLLAEVATTMSPLAEAKNLALIVEKSGVETVYADPQRLLQVVINLVSNAIKYTTQGEVRISAELEVRKEVRGLAIQVTDTGVGIKKEDLPKVFRRYEQLENPFHAGEAGTGLGLALTQELVTIHGGELSVSSHYGKGSQFTCWVPIE